MKRKRKMNEDQKAYNSYLMKMRNQDVPNNQTVVYWYFLALRKHGVNPEIVRPDHPEYGQNGSVIFPEEAEQPDEPEEAPKSSLEKESA